MEYLTGRDIGLIYVINKAGDTLLHCTAMGGGVEVVGLLIYS